MISSETKIRVRYADTDQMKIVYYGRYFEYFEQGRSDLLRQIGMPYPEIEKMGFMLPVIEAHAEYRQPAVYDDEITVRTILEEIPQAKVIIKYLIFRADLSEPIVIGHTIHSFVQIGKKIPIRPPRDFIEVVEKQFLRI
ncbi:MAG: acyl-CoA thioesterase [Bacteroidota bacterium]